MLSSKLADEFAAVTIKPNENVISGGGGVTVIGYQATGAKVSRVILNAYSEYKTQEWRDELLHGPEWVTHDRYDITAKFDAESEMEWQHLNNGQRRERIKPLLQKMLAKRFGLVIHRTTEEMLVNGLFVMSPHPRLRRSEPSVKLPPDLQALDLFSLGQGSGTIIPIQDGTKPELRFLGTPMSTFAVFMSGMSQQIVVDRTNLEGTYDFVLPRLPSSPDQANASDPAGQTEIWDLHSIGLKLKPVKSPVEHWVIDHINRPSDN